MKILRAYAAGVKQILKTPKLWILLFVLNLLFAVLIALPVKTFVNKQIGYHTLLNESIEKFDFIFISELLNHYGDHISGILNHGLIIILLYLIFYIFLTGGILESIIHHPGRFISKKFWGGAGYHFGRMLKLLIYFGLIHFVIFILFAIVFTRQGINPLKMESDSWIIGRAQWMIPLLILVEVIIAMIHDYIKVAVVRADTNRVVRSIRKQTRWIFRHFIQTFGLYLLNILIVLIVLFLGDRIQKMIPGSSSNGILIGFLMAQIFILLRIALKLVNFASIHSLYSQMSFQGPENQD